MAEVAASIAGLVSLSIQVLEKAQTIREFYSRTKNAPQTLLDLTERLELLSLILRQAELFTQCDSSDVELVKRCISQCQRSSTKIKDLIEKLDRCLSKNGIPGKIRIAMRDSEFSKLLVEIDQTIALLEISFQMYTLCVFRSYECAITTSSDSRITSQKHQQRDKEHRTQLAAVQADVRSILASSMASLHQPLPAANNDHVAADLRLLPATQSETTGPCGSIVEVEEPEDFQTPRSKRKPHAKRAKRESSMLGYRLSVDLTRIMGNVYYIAATRAETGWDIRLRTWRLRERESEIFRYCRQGDVHNVRRLLDSGEASAYDHYVVADSSVNFVVRTA